MRFLDISISWLPLADAVLKATVLFAGGAVASVLLRKRSAAVRHLVWTLALFSALALPLLSLALPRWQLPVVTIASPAPEPAAAMTIDGPRPATHVVAPALSRRAQPASPSALASSPTVTASVLPDISWQVLLLGVWVLGMLAIAGRVAAGLLAVQWLSRRTERVTDAPWLPLARELAAEVGVSGRVTFLRTRRASMPMAWGILRGAVLMPADADTWPIERLRIVLLHELAHVKRRDCLTHMVAQLSCALYWFNPLAWMAARHVRTERERACDDLVLASGTCGPDYADQLLEIARVMRGGRFHGVLAGASLAMAHRSQLEGRLMAILDPRMPRAGVSRVRTAVATAVFAGALMPLASMQPWAYEQEPSVIPQPAAEPAPPAVPTSTRAADAPQSSTRPIPIAKTEVQSSLMRQTEVEAQTPTPRPTPTPSPMPMPTPTPTPTPAPGWNSDNDNDKDNDGKQEGKGADPRTVAALTAALKDTDKEVRETALHALVQLRHPSIYDPLVQALSDASPDVREQAAFGLGQLRDRRAVQPLTGAMKDANASVREQAAFALGQLRDRSAVPVLTAALKDSSDSVREQAVFALGQLRDPAAFEALVGALRDAKGDVREKAVFALGELRDRRAVEPLISLLKDAVADVRQQAAFALGQLRDRGAVEALVIALKDSDADVREQVAFALGQLRDPRAIDALTGALKDSSADVRQQAAFALGQIRE
jgi:HEAT repeat protein/beta-lactamase regulating signal transducer with metallopeptidase domain